MHSSRWIRRFGSAGTCRIEHDRGHCGARELFALPRLVFVRLYGVCTRWWCVGAATLLGGAHAMCTAAAGFAGVTAMPRAELSTTGAIAARANCLLCRGLFSCGPAVLIRDGDAWVQRWCSVGRTMCAQLPLGSQVGVTAAWQLPNYILLTRECVLFNEFSQPFGHDRGRTLLKPAPNTGFIILMTYAFKFKVQSTHTTHDTTLLCATAFASMCGVHDPAPLRCSFASQTLQAHQLPPNQMRHRFGAG